MGVVNSPLGVAPRISTWTSGSRRLIQPEAGQRFRGGTASFLPECCVPAFGWPLRCDPDFTATKAVTPSCDSVSFDSIGVYADNRCPTGAHPSITDFQERSSRALASNWQYVLSEELMDGTWSALAGAETNIHGDPISNGAKGSTIRSAALTIAGGPTCMTLGLSALVREWRRFMVDAVDPEGSPRGARLGITPVLHIPDWALSFLPDGATEVRGREIWTNYGTVLVAPGPGYSGNAPHAPGVPPALIDMPPGQFWAYLTGMIHWDISAIPDPVYLDGLDGFEPRTNLETNITEMSAVAIFDPCAVFGILIEGTC